MKTEWLESFLATARTKSLTKASEQLHLTQPALSKQMRNLEEDLGVTLLIRSATGVRLTKAGEILFTEIQPVLQEIRSIQKKILSTKETSKLTIGTWPSIASFYLPYKIAKAKEVQKEVNVKITYKFDEILNLLANSEIDAALIDDRLVKHSYWSKPIFSENFCLFVNQLHPLACERHVYFRDFKNEPLVVLPPPCDVRMLVEQAYKLENEELLIASEVDFGQSIIGFISANLGISVLPEIFTNQIDHSTVKVLPIVDFKTKRRISLVTPNADVGKLIFSLILL
ncbi:LysR family transcriptional regulator [Paenibacillus kribbensis]|uniref:LysR family transcriptional regulator n=1 Tax=Paenibacillus kribbensis TaxID=172713 RepID=UPI0015BF2E52|nr:LysR family transcriptional regulator [Paenibacillus kribbensis]